MKEWETYNRAQELLTKAGLDEGTINMLNASGYFAAPASKGHHLAVPGGLAAHSVNVTERLVELTEKLCVEWPRPQSPYLVGMLHDLVKTKTYVPMYEEKGDADNPTYRFESSPYGGHGAASAMLAMSNFWINLYPAEVAAIRWHMGAFCLTSDELKEYDRALDEWPLELIATHTADMLASRVDERGL